MRSDGPRLARSYRAARRNRWRRESNARWPGTACVYRPVQAKGWDWRQGPRKRPSLAPIDVVIDADFMRKTTEIWGM